MLTTVCPFQFHLFSRRKLWGPQAYAIGRAPSLYPRVSIHIPLREFAPDYCEAIAPRLSRAQRNATQTSATRRDTTHRRFLLAVHGHVCRTFTLLCVLLRFASFCTPLCLTIAVSSTTCMSTQLIFTMAPIKPQPYRAGRSRTCQDETGNELRCCLYSNLYCAEPLRGLARAKERLRAT